MTINFKNRFIFFALANVWGQLDYKFKHHVNEIVTLNPDDEFVQEIEVPEEILIFIYQENSKQPQGLAKYINIEMQEALVSQLLPASNIQAVQAGTEHPNEASRILIACQNIDTKNGEYREAIIASGKSQILE